MSSPVVLDANSYWKIDILSVLKVLLIKQMPNNWSRLFHVTWNSYYFYRYNNGQWNVRSFLECHRSTAVELKLVMALEQGLVLLRRLLDSLSSAGLVEFELVPPSSVSSVDIGVVESALHTFAQGIVQFINEKPLRKQSLRCYGGLAYLELSSLVIRPRQIH